MVFALVSVIGFIAYDQARNAGDRVDAYVTEESVGGQTAAEIDIDNLQGWLDRHGLERIRIRKQVNDWISSLSAGEISGYVQKGVEFARGAREDLHRLDGHRTIRKHRYPRSLPRFHQFLQHEQELLGPLHGERRNHHAPAAMRAARSPGL